MKKLLILFISTIMISSCTYSESTEDTSEQQNLIVSDEAYYKQLDGQNISINVYNWGEYISDGSSEGTLDVNAEFTKLTGIKVNYSTYATNEELYAKLKGNSSSYDIVIPSDYMISRMIEEDMLEKINFESVPNFKYITDTFKNPEYDKTNEYSVPYTWGTVGIIFDKTAIDEKDVDWDILWNEEYKDQILMFDNPRDAFAVAALKSGYSLNTENTDEISDEAELLSKQKELVQAYVMDEIFDKMGAGEALIAPYYAGDAVTLMNEYDHLGFVIPESGTNLFFDAMCIPKNARQKQAAQMYINFMCEPDIAYATTSYIGYSTPNSEALKMIDDEVKNDGISYLDNEYLSEHTETFVNLSDDTNRLMQDKWTEMKSKNDENQTPWLVPTFMLICILASIGIIIARYIKRKKDVF